MNHFKYILAAAAIVVPFNFASAADIEIPAYDWSGLYVGVNLGGAATDFAGIYDTGSNPGPINLDVLDGTYLTIGGRLGYNHQIDNYVLGFEAEGAFGLTDEDEEFAITGFGTSFTTLTTELDSVGSIRARAGYAADRLLLVASAGIGYADYTFKGSQTGDIDGPPSSISKSDWGPVVGLGAEYAITDNAIISLAYSHYFTKSSVDLAAADFIDADGGDVIKLRGVDTINLGLTWKF